VFYRLYGPEPQRPAEVARELGLSLQRVRQIACELRKLIRLRLGEGDHV
jgi:DNA-directed RNA polymerase sigma subunit (sigma70/sigma32)